MEDDKTINEASQKVSSLIKDSFSFLNVESQTQTIGAWVQYDNSLRKVARNLSNDLIKAVVHQLAIDRVKKFDARFVLEVYRIRRMYKLLQTKRQYAS